VEIVPPSPVVTVRVNWDTSGSGSGSGVVGFTTLGGGVVSSSSEQL